MVLVIPKSVIHSILTELIHTTFNDLGFMVCCNNLHQPYPKRCQVVTNVESVQHSHKKCNDLYLKDQIWATKKHWVKRQKNIKMSTFCNSTSSQDLQEMDDWEDQLPGYTDTSTGFAVVMSCLQGL